MDLMNPMSLMNPMDLMNAMRLPSLTAVVVYGWAVPPDDVGGPYLF